MNKKRVGDDILVAAQAHSLCAKHRPFHLFPTTQDIRNNELSHILHRHTCAGRRLLFVRIAARGSKKLKTLNFLSEVVRDLSRDERR